MKTKTIINAKDITVRYADKVILDEINFSIHEGDRIGLIGRNGSGKSTLLKIISGQEKSDSGSVSKKNGLVISYLSQASVLDENQSIRENLFSSLKYISDKIEQYHSIPLDSPKKIQVENEIELLDGWNLDLRIDKAISSLSLPDGDRIISTLSGGEMRRVALCKALIIDPELLILDEPTNHMDTESIEWLENHLNNFKGSLLMVTHDRYFLDRVIAKIIEIKHGDLYSYPGNYTEFMILKAEHEAGQMEIEKKRQSFLRLEIDWIRRSPKARTTKSKSRIDKYYETLNDAPHAKFKDMELAIPPASKLGNKVLNLKNISMEYDGVTLFEKLNINFEKNTRIGIIGPNGAGKSTLLKIMLGKISPTTGKVVQGINTQFNYIDQKKILLNEQLTPFDEIAEGNIWVKFGDKNISIRAYLKRFLFTEQDIDSPIWRFSGGEKSRLILAKVLKKGGNFLIMDEPTNDLDISTLRVLEEALIHFNGALVVVSHDRYFLNRVCTGIVSFEKEHVVYHEGNYDYYYEKRGALLKKEQKKLLKQQKKQKDQSSQQTQKLSYNEKKELLNIQEKILIAESKVKKFEELFATPDYYETHRTDQANLIREFNNSKNIVQLLYNRWEELEDRNR